MPQGSVPALAIVQVGSLESSNIYVEGKKKFGEEIGVPVFLHQLPDDVSEGQVIDLVRMLNTAVGVGGIIVQMPLPSHISKERVIEAIDPEKDVDGLHPTNVKKLLENDPTGIVPATARGILSLLDFYSISFEGKRALVIGRSSLVGKPVAVALLNRRMMVTIAHRGTLDLAAACKDADIIVVAAGVPGLINASHVLPRQVIIDVGITREEGRVIKGDVAFEEVAAIVAGISPVPGGVGPLTIASLFQNVLRKYTDGDYQLT